MVLCLNFRCVEDLAKSSSCIYQYFLSQYVLMSFYEASAELGSSVGTMTMLVSRQGQGIFLFAIASRLALLSTQPLIQLVLGVKQPGYGFESPQGLGIFLFTTASRPALGPTQPPIQLVPGVLSWK
jgi:hypothetical protein